jgi:hypothetical protein
MLLVTHPATMSSLRSCLAWLFCHGEGGSVGSQDAMFERNVVVIVIVVDAKNHFKTLLIKFPMKTQTFRICTLEQTM